jgi:alkylation response protein AidB-like acyl-CoA dehydrogenase
MSVSGIFNSHLIMAHRHAHGHRGAEGAFLPRFATGEMRGGLALTEPDCGTDLQAIRTRARREGDDYVINGTKTWISNGIEGSCFALLVKTDPRPSRATRACPCCSREKGPGLHRVAAQAREARLQGHRQRELVFEDYRVPAENLIGGVEGKGWPALSAAWSSAASTSPRAASASPQARCTRRCATASSAHLRQADLRAPGDPAEARRDGDARRGRAAADLERGAAYDAGERCDMEAGMAKYFATEAALENALEAMRIHGGYGYSKEFNVERLYPRRAAAVHRRGHQRDAAHHHRQAQLIERNRLCHELQPQQAQPDAEPEAPRGHGALRDLVGPMRMRCSTICAATCRRSWA